MSSIPVIDISTWTGPGASSSQQETTARLLRDASHEPGFCQVVGHGVDPALSERLLELSTKFFALPTPSKQALLISNSPAFRGYTKLGNELTQGVSDVREQIAFGYDDPVKIKLDDPPWQRLRGANQWPADLPELQTVAQEWLDAMGPMAASVCRALAVSLGQPRAALDHVFTPRPDPYVKLVRYPAVAPGSSDQGVGLHHDSGLLTFILANDVPGLEVQIDGQIVPVEPRKDAFVMNLGEMMQTASDGYFQATKHRVSSPPQGPDRISIAYFFNPRYESVFTAFKLPADVAAMAPGGAGKDTNGDDLHATFGDNNLKTRLRSHPDVAERFYTDLHE
jgi:isopenicillin N synthase-like dioxygenase